MAIQDIQLQQKDAYLSNPNLKRANTHIQWTEEQILEFLKCKEDPVYFAKNYIKIDRKSTRLNSSHVSESRMPSSA